MQKEESSLLDAGGRGAAWPHHAPVGECGQSAACSCSVLQGSGADLGCQAQVRNSRSGERGGCKAGQAALAADTTGPSCVGGGGGKGRGCPSDATAEGAGAASAGRARALGHIPVKARGG